jgi:hypothetical protein
MSVWFAKFSGMNSELMREAAKRANVSWNYQKVAYKSGAIGFPDSDNGDSDIIQSELQTLLGYKPRVIDEPTIGTNIY